MCNLSKHLSFNSYCIEMFKHQIFYCILGAVHQSVRFLLFYTVYVKTWKWTVSASAGYIQSFYLQKDINESYQCCLWHLFIYIYTFGRFFSIVHLVHMNFISMCFSWIWTHDLCVASAMLYQLGVKNTNIE